MSLPAISLFAVRFQSGLLSFWDGEFRGEKRPSDVDAKWTILEAASLAPSWISGIIYIIACVRVCSVTSVMWPCGPQPTRLLCPWDASGKNTGMGWHALLQGIFPTQGSNPGFPHCRKILHCLSHQASPRILEWVDYPFSRGPSWPTNQTRVSCIAGGFFTNWATREAQKKSSKL